MNSEWEEIRSDYNKAKEALWCPRGQKNWHREEEIGRYYMWKAYHSACEAEPKDQLLYARILAMMADESRISTSDYKRYHKFIKPAAEAYALAEKAGQHPTDRERENIRLSAESLAYTLACRDASYEEQIRCIKGYEKLDDFGFHDSKPVGFEHTEKTARLKLKYDATTVTFLFEDIFDIHIDTDPLVDWVTEFCCYRSFYDRKRIVFDVGYYKIVCSAVTVERVEKE
jgi:hypothetical protein